MNYKLQVQRLIQSYEGAVAWGNADEEEALIEAIKGAFPDLQEDGKAELFARLRDAWPNYKDGMVPRKLWIGQVVNEFMLGRIGKAAGELKVRTNVPEKK